MSKDILEQLESLKADIKANPSLAESVGPLLRETIGRVRSEIGNVLTGAGGPAAYCHSHCGSHCISHPQGRLGMMGSKLDR